MKGFVANTDYDWYRFLKSAVPPVDEVNFWRPGETSFAALQPGEPLFFKLKAPHNAIAGLGFFAHYSRLPLSMVWDVYGPANGAATFAEMRDRLYRLRSSFDANVDPRQNFVIGCILLTQPVFFDEHEWVRMPDNFAKNIVAGKGYDLTKGEGARVWNECLERIASRGAVDRIADAPVDGYGAPSLVAPRLGQKSFRIAVLDTYERRCAITSERTLPALEAAHIQAFSESVDHSIRNGILFRADVHRLFDSGYVTVDPDFKFVVSDRIKQEFENGRDYYALHGARIRLPKAKERWPNKTLLTWHNQEKFVG